MNQAFKVNFLERSSLDYLSESDPPTLRCAWLPPFVLKWINRAVARLFTVDQKHVDRAIKTHVVQTDDVMASIRDQQDLIEMLYAGRVRKILLGPKQMRMAQHEAFSMSFMTPVRLSGPQGTRIYDIPVEIVPWMDGVLLLPEEPKPIPHESGYNAYYR